MRLTTTRKILQSDIEISIQNELVEPKISFAETKKQKVLLRIFIAKEKRYIKNITQVSINEDLKVIFTH